MTIREKLTEMLYNHGLFEKEAKQVVELYENSPLGEDMKGRLDDNLDDYPPVLMTAVWMGARKCAVQWIDTNKPQHWARAMFAE